MNDARALLDSLMGQTRNEAKTKQKKGKGGDGFKHDSVCKLHLVGFCPENEELFYNTRRDLGPCQKTHYEISKEEFNAHPDKERYQAVYEYHLLNHLSGILRRCEEWTAREQQKYEEGQRHKQAPNSEAKHTRDLASKMIADAEELASEGDFEGSKRLLAEAKEQEKKAADLEESAASSTSPICQICGERKSSGRASFQHETGKIHQGILMIRRMHKDLMNKKKRGELKVDEDITNEERELKESHEKERRTREREARERDAKQRREREEREDRERREKERAIQAKLRREKEDREREAREREARLRDEQKARRNRNEEREGRWRDEQPRHRDEELYRRDSQYDRHSSGGRHRSSDDRTDRNDVASDQCRRRSRSRSRSLDRHNVGGGGSRRRFRNDRGDPGRGSRVASEERGKRLLVIQEDFVDLLVESGAVTPKVTYRELEDILGGREQWKACPDATRREVAGEFMFTNLLASWGAVTCSSTYEDLEDILGHKEHWKVCPEAQRRKLVTEWIESHK